MHKWTNEAAERMQLPLSSNLWSGAKVCVQKRDIYVHINLILPFNYVFGSVSRK